MNSISHHLARAPLLSTSSPVACVCHRFRSKKVRRNYETKKAETSHLPTYQLAPDANKLKVHDRIFTWGLAATGALGFPGLVDPEIARQRDHWLGPRKMGFFHFFKIQDIACGYGFTVIAATCPNFESKLWGTGINSDFQLGLQQVEGSRKPLAMIYRPAPIVIPALSQSTRFRQVACGRCHTIVLTDDNEGEQDTLALKKTYIHSFDSVWTWKQHIRPMRPSNCRR